MATRTKQETDFIDKIDCNFPYQNKQECLKLIDEAASLSPEAMFSVVEELCRIPASEKDNVSTTFLLELLTVVMAKLDHPLKGMMLDAATNLIYGKEMTVEEVISKMEIVRKYPRQFAALSILYFSCDDTEGKVDHIWERICKEWLNP